MGQILSAPYDDIYDSFLAYQKPRVSVQGYGKLAGNTRRVLRWFEGDELVLEEVGIGEAVRYQASLSGRVTREGKAISAGSVINYLKTARSLFSWLVTNERIKSNPFLELPYPKSGEHLTRNELSEAQMGCLLSHLARFDEPASLPARLRRYRVHVVAEFLYATGLRIAEAASLVEANLDLSARLVYLPEGKGGKGRVAFLTGYASDVMARHLLAEAVMMDGTPTVHLVYSHKEWALIMGTTPETLSRVLTRFTTDGLICQCGRSITILDLVRIEEL